MKLLVVVLVSLLLLSVSGTSPIIDFINAMIAAKLGDLNTDLRSHIPMSYGNCNDNGPAQPCRCSNGCADLFYVHKHWEYEAYARWISGLQTMNITAIVFSASGTSIAVTIDGYFGELPASIRIAECATFDKCVKLWDNTHACCGNNKHFHFGVGVTCQNAFPYLNNLVVTNVTIDKFEITESIGPIKLNVKDITSSLESAFTSQATQYLSKEAFINYNGTKVTLLEFANNEIRDTFSGGFTCPTS
eukprot:TRINITY_DN5431_c0_g1_i1.p1 TRINITY_DN5431_c0_g1~~TRINITY_DN5431_c0_g1_i1.p1  ORF type:complete len:246 (-),score=35.01 TRINITY_DN5431_c0_g1_i1:70-807(-)